MHSKLPIATQSDIPAAGGTRHVGATAVDLHLIFPPQWSPFQPFLSTPSLKGYLNGRGHRVVQSDWNVGFYRFFVGRPRLARAKRRLREYLDILGPEHGDYRTRTIFALTILEDHASLLRKVEQLGTHEILKDIGHFKECVDAFQMLLEAFSIAEPVVEVRTSSLATGDVMKSIESIHAFAANEGDNPFAEYFADRLAALHERPRYFGISVIGIEQLLPALTLCRKVKDRFPETPIIIGGSVCSRMVEKDATVATLFGRYFDFVCRYEGERPMDALLASDDPRHERTPNLAFLEDGKVVMTPLCDPLGMNELPTPDFEDLPLSEYLSPELVLPLLTTRGCYWGKCAFCYHGMIYQDRYRMRDPKLVAADVETLHLRHGVRHFAFNDEAIPPKLFRLLPDVIPPHRYFFTGLYKFEKYFVPDDYRHMYEMGFRSLYIGLETASERVQRHMRKNNLQSTMLDNLRGAHDAGIWNHTFAFFGFPTETEAEADDTAQFLVRNADIIHSEGTGTFSFEHNAPIHHDPENFGIRQILEKPGRVLELYYDYEPVSGLDAEAALATLRRFNELKKELGVYQFGRWIPREHLLVLLSHYDRDRLHKALAVVEQIQRNASLTDTFSWLSLQDELGQTRGFVVNRATRHVYETNADAVTVLALLDGETTVAELCEGFPSLEAMI